MNYRFGVFLLTIALAGCSNNKKQVTNDNTDTVSIHKVWRYDTVRSASKNPGLIGKNLLDLTNKDTLRFSYQSVKDNTTSYAYHILHDTIFVNKNAAYKVVKITANELDLYTLFKSDSGKATKDSVIMIYKTK
ncbi:MAG: hypothetical protein ACHQF4_01500 [Sphingobacteriales bacterium]